MGIEVEITQPKAFIVINKVQRELEVGEKLKLPGDSIPLFLANKCRLISSSDEKTLVASGSGEDSTKLNAKQIKAAKDAEEKAKKEAAEKAKRDAEGNQKPELTLTELQAKYKEVTGVDASEDLTPEQLQAAIDNLAE